MSGAQAGAIHAPVANLTALKAIAAADRDAGMICMVLSDIAGEVSLWRFHATSTAADTSENLVAVPGVGSGRWLRADRFVALSLAATKDTLDAATLFTVPVGAKIHPREAWWETTQTFNGTTPKLGVHASPTGWDTPGDILGGATGDTVASTDSRMAGTIGAALDTRENGRLIMIAADTFKFDIVSGSLSTQGATKVRILCDVFANPGA